MSSASMIFKFQIICRLFVFSCRLEMKTIMKGKILSFKVRTMYSKPTSGRFIFAITLTFSFIAN